MAPSSLRRGQKHGRDEDYDSEGDSRSKAASKRNRLDTAKNRSPGRSFSSLALHEQGVVFREFSQLQPSSMGPTREFLRQIETSINQCRGILPCSFASAYRDQATKLGWGDHLFSSDRNDLGYTPPPEPVALIVAAAAKTSGRRHGEDVWNIEVHAPILAAALRPPMAPDEHLVDYTPHASGSIIPAYHIPAIAARRVDFSVYIDPTNDPHRAATKEAIAKLCRELPENCLNHTDYAALSAHPIAFSIETKRTSEKFDMAKLQLGIWLSAQWKFLQHLVERRQKANLGGDDDDDDDDDAAAHRQRLPAFLPGIIILGHDWHLVLSTLEKKQTIVWENKLIGSTGDALGVYKIIYMLQLLRQWAQDTYWPWLREVTGL